MIRELSLHRSDLSGFPQQFYPERVVVYGSTNIHGQWKNNLHVDILQDVDMEMVQKFIWCFCSQLILIQIILDIESIHENL